MFTYYAKRVIVGITIVMVLISESGRAWRTINHRAEHVFVSYSYGSVTGTGFGCAIVKFKRPEDLQWSDVAEIQSDLCRDNGFTNLIILNIQNTQL